MPIFIWPVVAEALVGALLGFCIPLAAAMATGGSGMAVGTLNSAGCWPGLWPLRMALVFLVAAGFAMPVVLLFRAALSGQTAHCGPVFTFSGLRLLCGDAG